MKLLTWLYILISALEIFGVTTSNETLQHLTKPLLMLILIAWYAKGVNGQWHRTHRLMVAAFSFSWVGDVALMFVSQNENYFLLGLVGFLITHVLYTIAFAGVSDKTATPLLPKKFGVTLPLLAYMGILLYLLVPAIYGNAHNRPVLAPVLVYTTAISIMVAFAINRYGRVNKRSFNLVLAGALMFMVSDSVIAVNKFLSPLMFAGIYIMVLYLAGQYLIARGMLEQFSETKKD